MSTENINHHIQRKLIQENMPRVSAVEAAKWLDVAGLLEDCQHRPGRPLRVLLRAGVIIGSEQGSNGRWHIYRTSASK